MLWNSTQNILPIHWKIRFSYNVEILRTLRLRADKGFWNAPRTIALEKAASRHALFIRILDHFEYQCKQCAGSFESKKKLQVRGMSFISAMTEKYIEYRKESPEFKITNIEIHVQYFKLKQTYTSQSNQHSYKQQSSSLFVWQMCDHGLKIWWTMCIPLSRPSLPNSFLRIRHNATNEKMAFPSLS